MRECTPTAAAAAIMAAHERTKHLPGRYAPGPGHLDWASQPYPFRRYEGAPRVSLDRTSDDPGPTYDSLFACSPSGVPSPSRALLSRLLLDSLAITAWKRAPSGDTWALRANPSSGNLHPTEAYLLIGSVDGIADEPALWHYRPLDHALEQLCVATDAWREISAQLPEGALLVLLTSIPWREAWKYGERALRYCQHDVGHAIGALAFAAAASGLHTQVANSVASSDLDAIAFGSEPPTGPEAEHADVLLVVSPASLPPVSPDWRPAPSAVERLRRAPRAGIPNRLSPEHRDWPLIERTMAAWRTPEGITAEPLSSPNLRAPDGPDRGVPASALFRRRRSAVAMDGVTSMPHVAFARLLGRLRADRWPAGVLGAPAHVALAFFVHRVEGLAPGLYLLPRHESQRSELVSAIGTEFEWEPADGAAGVAGLLRLAHGDVRDVAAAVSCGQDIASEGAFAVAMLARCGPVVRSRPWMYPRLYWECGLIGQILYLEAEAAGLRGTGIGCYFDDLVHRLLGIQDDAWQSLYHFTVGGPVHDPRLQTLPPYRDDV